MSQKKALIIGARGQDGTLLSRHLGQLHYQLTELSRGVGADICDALAMARLIKAERFDEIYHLAAYHHSSQETRSEDEAFYQKTFDVNFYSLLHVLEACRLHAPTSRIFYAASSHIFAPAPSSLLLNEESKLRPLSAYAQSKASAKFLCETYRREHKIFASVGILFNHESEFRADHFLSKKIIKALVRVKRGLQTHLELGDLQAEFDMGWAEDFVRAMHLILQTPQPADFVIATGKKHSVKDFATIVSRELRLDLASCVISLPTPLSRAPMTRIGDASRLKTITGWAPSVTFEEMVRILLKKELDQG